MDPRDLPDRNVADLGRERMRKKYLNLGTGELAAAATFSVVAIGFVSPRLDSSAIPALWSALVPLLAVLVQAGVYWLLARRWVKTSPMPTTVADAYRVLRVADAALLAAGLIGVVVWWPHHTTAAILVLAVWFFAAVEYINYFHVRLSYPVHRWFTTVGQWRTPQLIRDIHAAATYGQSK